MNEEPSRPARLRWRREAEYGLVYSVRELSRDVRELLESTFDAISVRGELTNVSRPRSGHIYMTLVDEGEAESFDPRARTQVPQIPVVLWRSGALRHRFRIENGMRVVITGRIGVYEPRGTYQVIAERIVPDGVGEHQLAFEQLRAKLEAEGLFDAERKRSLPFLPRRIGLVTSPRGAAIRDFLSGLERRGAQAAIRFIPVSVQGPGAAEEIAAALERFSEEGGVDVIVVTRGGGSIEDLWAFNEEPVARAIARCSLPVVSAIGHEVDVTISDYVADLRAPTPTAAAELVTPDRTELVDRIRRQQRALNVAMRTRLRDARTRVDRLARSPVLREPERNLEPRFERLARTAERLGRATEVLLRERRDRFQSLTARLEGLSPLAVLSRGYSVVERDGRLLRDASDASSGDRLRVRLARGEVDAEVVKVRTARAGRAPRGVAGNAGESGSPGHTEPSPSP